MDVAADAVVAKDAEVTLLAQLAVPNIEPVRLPRIEPVTIKLPDTFSEPDTITVSCLNCKGVFHVVELSAIRKSILFNAACASCPVWIL
jgi:hypothetical protein